MIYALLWLWAQAEEGAKQGQPGEGANPLVTFFPLILMVAAFYFLIIMPARRREKQQRELLFNTLKKNDEVLTNSGIIGTVANMKDDEVSLKVDESSNVRIRILRSSIVRIIKPKEPASDQGSESVKAGMPPAKG